MRWRIVPTRMAWTFGPSPATVEWIGVPHSGQNAISRFIVLTSRRIAEAPDEPESQKLSTLLMG